MSYFLHSKELYLLLLLASKFVWLYFSGKYTIGFLTEFSSGRMLGVRAKQASLPLIMAILWACFLFAC
jgi:hypothetical protein